ncbi:hypothetical protein vBVnaSL3_60 [Vibrio phage vB_VnaS-L3]|nr:hypothetical protein vBVnaSL3_60 [Vibrio phage vB_VnaS-L3]
MTFLDAVKVFEDDLKAKVNIPVHNKNIPTDGVSMRVALNNADADGLFLNSGARVMTGQFNVEISAQLGTNKYDMIWHANKVLSVYVRGYSVPVLDRRVLILQANQSSPYPTEAHQKINVIIDFQITK